jgi:multisubunit Na+/H+ antiporter MnhE subunit
MNVVNALATVVGTGVGFGIAGTAIGAILGYVAPGFFRQMLPLRDPANLNPVEVGIGLGLTNGLGWGLAVGVLLVAILAWRETRLARKERHEGANAPQAG